MARLFSTTTYFRFGFLKSFFGSAFLNNNVLPLRFFNNYFLPFGFSQQQRTSASVFFTTTLFRSGFFQEQLTSTSFFFKKTYFRSAFFQKRLTSASIFFKKKFFPSAFFNKDLLPLLYLPISHHLHQRVNKYPSDSNPTSTFQQ